MRLMAHLELSRRPPRLSCHGFLQVTAHSTLVVLMMVAVVLGVMAGRVCAICHCLALMLRGDGQVQLVLAVVIAVVRLLAQPLLGGPVQILLGRLLEH